MGIFPYICDFNEGYFRKHLPTNANNCPKAPEVSGSLKTKPAVLGSPTGGHITQDPLIAHDLAGKSNGGRKLFGSPIWWFTFKVPTEQVLRSLGSESLHPTKFKSCVLLEIPISIDQDPCGVQSPIPTLKTCYNPALVTAPTILL